MTKLFLSEERNRLGLKAKDVAHFVGIALSTQSNYEHGKRFPDTQYLSAISKLGFDLTYVITGERHHHNLDTQEQLLIQLFREAPTSVKRHILSGLLSESSVPNIEDIQDAKESKSVSIGNNNQGDVTIQDINI